MLTLQGTLRKVGAIKTADSREFTKLWVEHETAGTDDRPGDLQILEFMLPQDKAGRIPPEGSEVAIEVRTYAKGRDVAFQALRVIPGPGVGKGASEAVAVK